MRERERERQTDRQTDRQTETLCLYNARSDIPTLKHNYNKNRNPLRMLC